MSTCSIPWAWQACSRQQLVCEELWSCGMSCVTKILIQRILIIGRHGVFFFGSCIRNTICFNTSLRIRCLSLEILLVIGVMLTNQRSGQLCPWPPRCNIHTYKLLWLKSIACDSFYRVHDKTKIDAAHICKLRSWSGHAWPLSWLGHALPCACIHSMGYHVNYNGLFYQKIANNIFTKKPFLLKITLFYQN